MVVGTSAVVALGAGEDLVCILILILRRAPADEETDLVDETVLVGGEMATGLIGSV